MEIIAAGSEKKVQEHKQQFFFVNTSDIFAIKRLTSKFHITKKMCCTCKDVFFAHKTCWFFAVLAAVAV